MFWQHFPKLVGGAAMSSCFQLPLLLLILLIVFLPSTIAQPAFTARSCSNGAGNYTAGSAYGTNLNNLLTSMAVDDRTTTGFYNLSLGQGPDRVNAIGLCRGDVGLGDCRSCIANATGRILQDCPVQKEAFGFYEFCTLRYSNRTIYGVLEPGLSYYLASSGNASDPTQFNAALGTLLTWLRGEAEAGSSVRKFATGTERQGSFGTIYGLVQCSPDLPRQLCDDCLAQATAEIPGCCGGRIGGRVVKLNCNLRFETSRFYSETESPPPPSPPVSSPLPEGDGGGENTSRTVAIVVPVIGAVVLGAIFAFFFWRRRRLKRSRIPIHKSSQKDTTFDEIEDEGCLQFNFETIRDATNDFYDGNKLGEGGFGTVYKGTLTNGQEVAVKRLAINSGQGDLEFKNEVKLVAKLQHRNLVKLLGFCLEGSERLLVYEFVPNASLDHFLFDANKRMHLDWQRRYKIIGGIARGLVYLHEDSRVRIIHRDLKTSNILLDAEMSPKIADFGMARLFDDIDETQGNTSRIVGTYGYMAPEYVMHGQFSVKSDVFSFGVLVLEIVSGQKNNNYLHHGSSMEDLLSYTWKNWRAGTYTNVVDPSLLNDVVSGTEIARCIHIGLLCVQENVNDRPTMATVLLMLTSHSMTLPLPSTPAFFMHTGGTGPQDEIGAAGGSSSWGYSSASRSREGITTTTGRSSLSGEADLPLARNGGSITVDQPYPR